LSGRHKGKQKAKKKHHTAASATTPDIQPKTGVAKEQPSESKTAATGKSETDMKHRFIRKPDPFDLALWGFFVGLVVAGIYYLQLRSMQDSVDLARKALQIDQRAWLKPTIPNYFPFTGASIPADVQITNIGKTVATNVTGKIVGTVLKKGATPRFNEYNVCYMNLNAGAVWLNEAPPLIAHLKLLNCAEGAKSGEAIVPTPELTRQINENKESFIIFYEQLNYCDVFGVKHQTT
jgi:hypothetical protein